jgi:1-acyl-sn-glycerol-3-phosphate acyltransferase
MLAIAYRLRIKISWLGKHTLFSGPFGAFFRRLGGVPVDRRKPGGIVAQVAASINAADSMWLAVPPTGTRKYSDYWKSGFYHIAYSANVPILLCYLDYAGKAGGIGPILYPTGDLKADMDKIREFYAGVRGKFPEMEGAIRLKDEEEPAGESPTAPPAQPVHQRQAFL